LGGLGLRNNIAESAIVVGEIGDQIVMEHPQVFGESHLVLNCGANLVGSWIDLEKC